MLVIMDDSPDVRPDWPGDVEKKDEVLSMNFKLLPQKKRKKRFAEAELLAKLRRYEDHLNAYGADIDAINSGGIVSLPGTSNSKRTTEGSSVDQHLQLPIRRGIKHANHTPWTGVNEELFDTEDMLQGSSEDETFAKPITRTFDAIKSDAGEMLFYTPTDERLIDLHPPMVQIFRLWQTFLDNINPIIKIFHAPTIQAQILEASAALDNISKEMEVLMFGIYATAISSLTDLECNNMFGEDKEVLRLRYSGGVRQALHRAGLLRTSNVTILQGLVLYLVSCLNFHIDPRSLFCLTGIAVRIGQRMGLCYDGSSHGLKPFETEMRRRLWWQIVILDIRVAEVSGAGCSSLTYMWTTKLPSNVNDSSLYPDMRIPPPEHKGVTEMVYVLLLCEATSHFNKMRSSQEPLHVKDKELDDFVAHLENTYLQYCDASIPLHALSIFMTRIRIAKLRMAPRHPHLVNTKQMNADDKDMLFSLSLDMIQNHNTLLKGNIMRFFWHIVINVPFPAYVCLLVSLRTRIQDEMADKAWEAFMEVFNLRAKFWDRREESRPKDSAIHAAVANLALKSWDAREKARPGIEVPAMIFKFKEEVRAKKAKFSKAESAQTETPPQNEGGFDDVAFTDSFWMDQSNDGMGQATDLGSGLMNGILTGQENGSVGMGMGWDFWNDLIPMNGKQSGNGQGFNGPNMYSS
ncbi:uncharacterized protein RAG0_13724 [Rhynchosporium agropyri]|uniref:Xylanolytic transcriptional activator regulatory domain-containing protein n=1 Tax=Rhynchosporium agropyri TaxID=914238 RepID=A0A1E1LDU7_9HELO|nr:uncharacterized protein RAG0_13724 [Rhynchosporium agropyri]